MRYLIHITTFAIKNETQGNALHFHLQGCVCRLYTRTPLLGLFLVLTLPLFHYPYHHNYHQYHHNYHPYHHNYHLYHHHYIHHSHLAYFRLGYCNSAINPVIYGLFSRCVVSK